jgi:hypothetical protein
VLSGSGSGEHLTQPTRTKPLAEVPPRTTPFRLNGGAREATTGGSLCQSESFREARCASDHVESVVLRMARREGFEPPTLRSVV